MSCTSTRRLVSVALVAAACACSEKPSANPRATIRLSPESVTASELDAARLADRDTTAAVAVSRSTTVSLRFRHDVEIRRLKVQGARSLRVHAEGFSLGAENEAGWAAAEAARPTTVRELTVTLEPTGPGASLNELEVWGAGQDVETRPASVLAEFTRSEDEPERENVWVLRARPGSAALKPGGASGESCLRARFPAADPRQARAAFLVFEANLRQGTVLQHAVGSDAPQAGFWLGTADGTRTVVQELDPERLRGADEVLLCLPDDADGTVDVDGLRLVLMLDDGREAFERQVPERFRMALDRDDGTAAPFAAGPQLLELDRARDIESVELRLAHAPARIEALARKDGTSWREHGGLELSSVTSPLPLAGHTSALRVKFAGSARADVPAAAVAELKVVGSAVGPRTGSARIVLTSPPLTVRDERDVGVRFGPKAYVAGWAESPAGRGTVEIEGARVDVDGGFAQVLRRPLDATGSWPVTLRARFPDGSEVTRTLYLDDDREEELLGGGAPATTLDARFGRENESRYGMFDPEAGGTVALGSDAYIVAPPGAVRAKTSIGITRKGHEAMPRLDPGMINVTAPAHAAYRFLPRGQKFAAPVKVVLPYDPDLLPEGVLPEEVQTYYFDETLDRWQTLPRREVRRDKKHVVSETTHFTFMINAVMVLPDHPGPASFNPNSIKDLKAADPSAGIDLVEPPQGNNQGTARLGFPIRLPKARGAYQPALSVSYDSGNGNGWLGVGWNVPVSRIQIDTRYGVPEYLGEERYLLDGEAIVPLAATGVRCIDGVTMGREYRARVERDFRKILRCGEDPARYWFEVMDKGGTLFLFGHGENARLASYIPRVMTPPVFPPVYDIAEWYLERVIDANGNLAEFAYQHDSPTGAEPVHREPFRQVYLRSIQYSGSATRREVGALTGGTPGVYLVELHHEATPRPDEVSSAREGFKTVLRRRLGSIEVRLLAGFPSGLVRKYVLTYRQGDMRKSLLEKIEVQGADERPFYSHTFEYSTTAPDQEGVTLFDAPVPWVTDGADWGLSGSTDSSFGFHGFAGIGITARKKTATVGIGFGFGRRRGETLVSTFDLNGDGLPDRVYSDRVLFNEGGGKALNPNPPEWDPGAKLTERSYGLDGRRLGRDSGNSFDASLQAFFGAGRFGGALNVGASWASANSSDFVIDANGDGLPDFVNDGKVFFNQPRYSSCEPGLTREQCCPASGFCFAQSMPMEALQELGDSAELLAADPTLAQAKEAMEKELTPEDAVLEWTAPYDGAVDVSGQLAFANATLSGERRDGVRLRMYRYDPFPLDAMGTSKSPAELKATYLKLPGDEAATPIELGNIPVSPGTVLYFVLSTLSDFPMNDKDGKISPVELASFMPVITYRGAPAVERSMAGSSGVPLYRFDAAKDFVTAGGPQGSVNVPRDGVVSVELDVHKRPTSDNVRVCVQYQDPPPENGTPPPLPGACKQGDAVNRFYKDYAPGSSLDEQLLVSGLQVKAGGTLFFRVDTDVSIDMSGSPRSVGVTVSGTYTCAENEHGDCVSPDPSDQDEQNALSFHALPYMPLHGDTVELAPTVKSWKPSGQTLRPFRVTKPGTLTVSSAATNATREVPIFFTVRTLGQQILKVAGDHGTVSTDGVVAGASTSVHLEPGALVFMEAHSESARSFDPRWTEDGAWAGPAWNLTCTFLPDAASNPWNPESCDGYAQFTSDGHADAWDGNQPILAGGFHGWRYGAWNGKEGEPFAPWVFRGPTQAATAAWNGGGGDDLVEAQTDSMQKEDDPQRVRLRLAGLLVPNARGTVLTNGGTGFEDTGDAFVSQDGNTYFTAGRVHAGWKGESASFRERGPDAPTVQKLEFKIGKIGRSSSSITVSGSASLNVDLGIPIFNAGVSLSTGLSQQKLDALDMNGDGILDVVVGAGMPSPFSKAKTIVDKDASSHVRLTSPVRLSTARTVRMNGFPQITRDIGGQINLGVSSSMQHLTSLGNVEAVSSRFPSFGGGLAFSVGSVLEQLLDVNGDGLPDAVRVSTSDCPSGIAVHLNMGTSFAARADCIDVNPESFPNDSVLAKVGVARGPALRRSSTVTLQGTSGAELGFRLGGGVDGSEAFGASVSADTSLTATNVAFVDVTGDGLPDYVYKANSGDDFVVRVNTGYGFAPARAWHGKKPWCTAFGCSPLQTIPRLHLGIPNVANSIMSGFVGNNPITGIQPLEATGSHSVKPSYAFSFNFSFPIFIAIPWIHIGAGASVSPKKVSGFELGLQDIDGDGLPDQVLKTSDNAPVWVRLNQLGKSNLLTGVSRPLRGSIELAYDQRIGNTVDMPQSRWVLTNVVVHDGRGVGAGHDLETGWAYEHGRHDRYEREFLGFAKVTRTNPDGTSVEQEFDNETVLTKGLLLSERAIGSSGNRKVLVETVNTWGKPIQLADASTSCKDSTPIILRADSYCGSFFTKLDAVEKRYYEGEPTPGVVTRQRFVYNENGDVGGLWDDGDLADPLDDTTAAIAYFADDDAATALHSLSRPKSVQIWAARDGRLLRSRSAEYDKFGNLTRLVAALGDGRHADTRLHWHDNGTLDWVEGPENESRQRYKTTYGYDPVALTYIAAIKDESHGYLSTAEYDARFGEATRTTDVNGKVTARKLDAFGRVTRVAGPKDTLDAPTVAITYAHDEVIPYAWTKNRLPRSGTDTRGTVDTVIAMDGLGRVIQTKKTAEIATSSMTKGVGWSVTGHQVFDVMGRVIEQGQTFASFNSRPEYVTGTPKNPTRVSYDQLGRMIQTVEPNGAITRVEYGFGTPAGSVARRFKTTTTDAEGKSKAAYKDASDRIVAVEERIEDRTPTTHYEYSPVGELVKVVDAGGNATHLTYDLLGRRTRLVNPDTGEIRFELDPAGNLVRKYDANLAALRIGNPFIHYVYDYDQLVRIEYPDPSRNVTYTYGAASTAAERNGVGRVIEVKDDAGRELRSYGELGELTSTTRILAPMPPYFREQTFQTSFKYDSFGRMMSITYPDGEKVEYTYDAGGLLERAVGHRAARTAVPGDEVYLASMVYDEFGQRARMLLGNGVASTFTYDPLTRRLASLSTITPLGRTLQAITYGYDRVGNIKTMVNGLGQPVGDQSGTVSFRYEYDDLYRLASASGEAKSRAHTIDRYTASYRYSDIHNMTSNVQIHEIVHGGDTLSVDRPPKTNHAFAYDYDPAAPHRARKIGDTFLVYDGNGNTVRECRDAAGDPSCGPLTDHLRTYAWSAENRLDHVIDGGGRNITRFVYDAAGDRVVKLGRGGEQITVGQFWALKGRRAATKHVFAGATRLASKLLPPPGWEQTAPIAVIVPAAIITTAALEPSTATTGMNDNGCIPSNYQPQKCPALPGGEPVINHQYDDTRVRAETYYYHQDHLGSTSWVTDQHARVHEHVEYFPYGAVWRDPRSDSDGGPVKGQRFLFTGKEIDEETGLYYFGARYYDARRARWIIPDPLLERYVPGPGDADGSRLPAGGVFATLNMALYHYSWLNPLKFVDPDGRITVLAVGRQTENNVFGHVAIVINDRVYSYGTNWTKGDRYVQDWGRNADQYLQAQDADRQTELVVLRVDPRQEALLQQYLEMNNPNEKGARPYSALSHSCVTVSEDALKAAGILPEHIRLPLMEEPPGMKLADSLTPSELGYRAKASGAVEGSAIRGTSNVSEAGALIGTFKYAADKISDKVSQ